MKLHYKVVCVIKFKYNINSRHQSSYDGDIVGIGLHPYDWTDRVRRVWRGMSLFSRLSSTSLNSSGGR